MNNFKDIIKPVANLVVKLYYDYDINFKIKIEILPLIALVFHS